MQVARPNLITFKREKRTMTNNIPIGIVQRHFDEKNNAIWSSTMCSLMEEFNDLGYELLFHLLFFLKICLQPLFPVSKLEKFYRYKKIRPQQWNHRLNNWLDKSQYLKGVKEFVNRWTKCKELKGDYVGKWNVYFLKNLCFIEKLHTYWLSLVFRQFTLLFDIQLVSFFCHSCCHQELIFFNIHFDLFPRYFILDLCMISFSSPGVESIFSSTIVSITSTSFCSINLLLSVTKHSHKNKFRLITTDLVS